MELTHISLFSGIGGNELAAQWAGFQTVLMCEIDPFCRAVLRKHFPGIPIIEDVHDVTFNTISQSRRANTEARLGMDGNLLQKARRNESANRINSPDDGNANRITLLTAGVPCQPASVAGKRRGKRDDRWLWSEAIRVMRELQPAWAVFENPAGIISLDERGGVPELEVDDVAEIPCSYPGGLDGLCAEIEQAGYSVQPVLIPACAVNAFHRRDRVFIIAHSNDTRDGTPRSGDNGNGQAEIERQRNVPFTGVSGLSVDNSRNVFYPAIEGLPDWAGGEMGQPAPLTEFERPGGGEIECEFRFLADGLSERLVRPVRNRVSQLKAYGNAVVPEQIYPIFKAIAFFSANK